MLPGGGMSGICRARCCASVPCIASASAWVRWCAPGGQSRLDPCVAHLLAAPAQAAWDLHPLRPMDKALDDPSTAFFLGALVYPDRLALETSEAASCLADFALTPLPVIDSAGG